MSKKLHVDCFLVGNSQAKAFRQLVRAYNEPSAPEHEASEPLEAEALVEILYEESGRDTTGFDLWFATPATGFRFGLKWGERRLELAQQPAEAPYPRFLYSSRLGYWCRQNAPGHFCLVSAAQLQVRREQEQSLFEPGEWAPITEAQFLQAYRSHREALHQLAQVAAPAQYLRRGHTTNSWLYCNAEAHAPNHLRLNVSQDAHGRSWQLLYARDVRPQDARRVASSEQEFSQQLAALLADADAVATGQPEGGPAGG